MKKTVHRDLRAKQQHTALERVCFFFTPWQGSTYFHVRDCEHRQRHHAQGKRNTGHHEHPARPHVFRVIGARRRRGYRFRAMLADLGLELRARQHATVHAMRAAKKRRVKRTGIAQHPVPAPPPTMLPRKPRTSRRRLLAHPIYRTLTVAGPAVVLPTAFFARLYLAVLIPGLNAVVLRSVVAAARASSA